MWPEIGTNGVRFYKVFSEDLCVLHFMASIIRVKLTYFLEKDIELTILLVYFNECLGHYSIKSAYRHIETRFMKCFIDWHNQVDWCAFFKLFYRLTHIVTFYKSLQYFATSRYSNKHYPICCCNESQVFPSKVLDHP